MSGEKLFISYSRRDQAFVNQVTDSLRDHGFDVWRDIDDITPGTFNWEKLIRHAISESVAVVLIASPNSLNSEYVQGELTLAKRYERPVFPVWAWGDNWIDCIPLDMVNVQFVDARQSNHYDIAVLKLVSELQTLVTPETATISVTLPDYKTLTIPHEHSATLSRLTNKIYTSGLVSWYPPYTYGKDWVLADLTTQRLILPWQWLALPEGYALSKTYPGWSAKSLDQFSIEPDAQLGVWDLSRLTVLAFALQDESIAEKLQSEDSMYELIKLLRDHKLELKHPHELPEDASFTYQFFLGVVGQVGVFVTQTVNNLSNTHQLDLYASHQKYVVVESMFNVML